MTCSRQLEISSRSGHAGPFREPCHDRSRTLTTTSVSAAQEITLRSRKVTPAQVTVSPSPLGEGNVTGTPWMGLKTSQIGTLRDGETNVR